MAVVRRISVLLIDHSTLALNRVKEALGLFEGELVVTRADTLGGAIATAAAGGIDVALLDLSLPDSQGMETLRIFRDEVPTVPVVVLADVADRAEASRAEASGAQDYLVKSELHPGVLVRALRHATQRNAIMNAWRVSEETLQAVFSGARDGIVLVCAQDGAFCVWNRGFTHMIGYDAREMRGMKLRDILPHSQRAEAVGRVLGSPSASGDSVGDVPVVRKDGSLFYAEVSVSRVRLSETDHYLGIFRDVTDRRLAAEALRESEARYRRVTDQAKDIVWHVDLAGKVRFVNQAVETVLGKPPGNVLGVRFADYVTQESKERVAQWLTEALANGGSSDQIRGEIDCVRADGRRVPVEINAALVRDDSGQPLFVEGVARDITERRQFLAGQRMEAIGRLAGGVSHDFSNILAVINAYAGFLLDACGHDESQRADLHVIRESAEKAARLTRQLLAFSRRQVQELEVLNPNTVITELSKLLSRLIGENLVYSAVLAENLWPVRVDRSQLEQIVMNLAVNARDAVSEAGTVTIETHNLTLTVPRPLGATAVEPGDYVVIKVSDTGEGMDAETRAQAFEPFFTTKEHGKGTGLGLSTVYGIAKQSNGYVQIDSRIGKGTTVTVYLPKTDSQMVARDGPRVSATLHSAGATILIVEDERLVCKAARRILTSAGYSVLEALHPNEALSICKTHDGAIDLMLSDVVMPEMSGFKLAELVADIRPRTRVLHMSGHADETVDRLGGAVKKAPILQKPFTTESMLSTVGRVLECSK